MIKPNPTAGIRHIALFVNAFEECLTFYTHILAMVIEWRPDDDNAYLTSANDNLALHRYKGGKLPNLEQRLDHIGFILKTPDDVDQWYEFMQTKQVRMKTAPKEHRDGAKSFYCFDPDGNTVQMIYHPPISQTN